MLPSVKHLTENLPCAGHLLVAEVASVNGWDKNPCPGGADSQIPISTKMGDIFGVLDHSEG